MVYYYLYLQMINSLCNPKGTYIFSPHPFQYCGVAFNKHRNFGGEHADFRC
jgi:hypothetical protein